MVDGNIILFSACEKGVYERVTKNHPEAIGKPYED